MKNTPDWYLQTSRLSSPPLRRRWCWRGREKSLEVWRDPRSLLLEPSQITLESHIMRPHNVPQNVPNNVQHNVPHNVPNNLQHNVPHNVDTLTNFKDHFPRHDVGTGKEEGWIQPLGFKTLPNYQLFYNFAAKKMINAILVQPLSFQTLPNYQSFYQLFCPIAAKKIDTCNTGSIRPAWYWDFHHFI